MKDYKVVVAGGRDFKDFEKLTEVLDSVLRVRVETHNIVIVSGAARGADSLGEKYAIMRGYKVDTYKANWDALGKSAGYVRNKAMSDNSNASVIFWDGVSKGSKHMIDITVRSGKPFKVVHY